MIEGGYCLFTYIVRNAYSVGEQADNLLPIEWLNNAHLQTAKKEVIILD